MCITRLSEACLPYRQLKVTAEFHEYQLKQAPQERTTIGQILLKGHWLVKAGFSVDSPVKVRVMESG